MPKLIWGALMEKAGRGETVYIVKGRRRFVLQEVPEIEPIPIRPPNYFANLTVRAEIQADNRLAKALGDSRPQRSRIKGTP